ncbi:hypothetical protein TcasGA2_TC004173 [Tribolium castaneum]|uniref:DUF4817 domain-containing protein n=1 Tax=Tribolium castaneum TaxID=7070 RepID=D7EJC1_TRICA|nr:hypothetical protein TcasGA2_TC004173 [Tribolium castaneum]
MPRRLQQRESSLDMRGKIVGMAAAGLYTRELLNNYLDCFLFHPKNTLRESDDDRMSAALLKMPFQYSFLEKLDMVLIFGECLRNASQAARVYAEKFPDRSHPHRTTFPALSRSPNLTAPDFFLWGTVKEMVYRETPTTIEDMRERIRNAFIEMNELNLAARVHANFKRRICLCLDQNGHQFEHLM